MQFTSRSEKKITPGVVVSKAESAAVIVPEAPAIVVHDPVVLTVPKPEAVVKNVTPLAPVSAVWAAEWAHSQGASVSSINFPVRAGSASS